MSTFISGVASCAAIDTSGELVDIKGLDISSLPKSGVINFEHDIAKGPKGEKLIIHIPAQIVGKIIKAKKIFSTSDCSNDNELYFWNKTQLPMVYIVAELLDDYCDSAREVAGKFKYSRAHPEQHAIFGFSVEGGELPGTRQGIVITRSIGRKVTVTLQPANHMCIAEIYEAQQPSQVKDDFESLFKSEAHAIEMFKSEIGHKSYEQFLAKKEKDFAKTKDISQEYGNKGIKAGTNSSGEHVHSHGNVRPYKFNPSEHQETGEHRNRAVVTAQNPKLGDNASSRHIAHAHAAESGARQENRPALSLNQKNKMSSVINKEPVNEVAKSEEPLHGIPRGWTPKKSQLPKIGTVLSMSHPEHGTVTIHKNPANSQFEVNHAGKTAGIKGKKGSFGTNVEAINHAQKYVHALHSGKVLGRSTANMSSNPKEQLAKSEELQLNKALEAGSYNAAPSTLVNGAAYQTEGMSRKQATTGAEDHDFHGTKKKTDWYKRAKEEYERWPHKQKFEDFMKARMPHLHKGEIAAIGRTIALSKSLDFEKSLGSLVKSDYETGVHKPSYSDPKGGTSPIGKEVRRANEFDKEWKKKPLAERVQRHVTERVDFGVSPTKYKTDRLNAAKKIVTNVGKEAKAIKPNLEKSEKLPTLKTQVKSKVARVQEDPDLKGRETVHLESGHALHGHPAGKFKAGDSVVAKPHIMGTHLLEHDTVKK